MAAESPAPKKKVAKKKTAKKTVPKKKVVAKKKAAAKKAAPGKRVATKAPEASSGKLQITAAARMELISKGAYHISMKRHPCEGNMEGDWMAAEAVIDMLFEVES